MGKVGTNENDLKREASNRKTDHVSLELFARLSSTVVYLVRFAYDVCLC